ncbi:UNVERIFIED_CONTAM: hypothetical protein K2H54_030523 [Gekko kuhli]
MASLLSENRLDSRWAPEGNLTRILDRISGIVILLTSPAQHFAERSSSASRRQEGNCFFLPAFHFEIDYPAVSELNAKQFDLDLENVDAKHVRCKSARQSVKLPPERRADANFRFPVSEV